MYYTKFLVFVNGFFENTQLLYIFTDKYCVICAKVTMFYTFIRKKTHYVFLFNKIRQTKKRGAYVNPVSLFISFCSAMPYIL